MRKFLFTSESVGEGHPDKICDQISDAILDSHLQKDPFSKIAIETMVKSDTVILAGEISSKAKVNCVEIAREVIKDVGYDFDDIFDYKTVNVLSFINRQSSDIADAVGNNDKSMGAGDQGIMFGYATDETEEKMPITLVLAHKIVKKLKELRKTVSWIRPDCKSQVTVEYSDNNGVLTPLRIDNIVVSCQHNEEIETEDLRKFIIEEVIKKVVDEKLLKETKFYNSNGEPIKFKINDDSSTDLVDLNISKKTKFLNPDGDFIDLKIKNDSSEDCNLPIINLVNDLTESQETIFHIQPSGKFIIGGPTGDAGLTGRKIIVDTYGGFGAHGGGCFSGKDCSKVDRSGAYAARWIAKSLVCSKICKRALVQISYAIGLTEPLSIFIETYGTGNISNEEILEIIKFNFDLRPGAIVEELGLRKPIFRKTATFGHFGNGKYPWEVPKILERIEKPKNNKI